MVQSVGPDSLQDIDNTTTGTRVPGTTYQLDPIRGAFNIGTTIRWLDFNDCFLAAECKVDFGFT